MPRQRSPTSVQGPWKAQLRDLLHDCVASTPAEQADRIREAQALLSQGATGSQPAQAISPDTMNLERTLGLGAHESAVIALIGGETPFMISRGTNGNCLASVVPKGASEGITAEGSTLALALLAAFLTMLLAIRERAPGPIARSAANPGLRVN